MVLDTLEHCLSRTRMSTIAGNTAEQNTEKYSNLSSYFIFSHAAAVENLCNLSLFVFRVPQRPCSEIIVVSLASSEKRRISSNNRLSHYPYRFIASMHKCFVEDIQESAAVVILAVFTRM